MSTADYLIELGTEELPPKSLKTLAASFESSFKKQLQEAGLQAQNIKLYAAPRRLALALIGLQTAQADQSFERKGPSKKAAFDEHGQPTKAVLGFIRGAGCDIDQLETIDTKKGEWLVYRGTTEGKKTAELLPNMLNNALKQLPIAKRMRWGASRNEFVRPIQWLVFLENDQVINCSVMDVAASNQSQGHRFHANRPITISSATDYVDALKAAYVLADYDIRQQKIKQQAQEAAAAKGLTVIIEQDLLDEVTSLNEWPVALVGQFEDEFLTVPQEALISSMNEHQKYFHTENEQGEIQPYFIFVANIESSDPAQVIAGNEKVIRPRLADAKFFWDTDKKTPLAERLDRLKPIVFQKQLGTVFDKVQRISKVAVAIAQTTDANIDHVQRAALLIKNDLTTDMVFEFTDLQGIAGSYYANFDGEHTEVAQAIKEHYLPKFAGDDLPSSATGITLAIADRMDTIVGLFGIGQPPTGTKDPYALRRAALGILRILVEKNIPLDLASLIAISYEQFDDLPAGEQVKAQIFDYMLDRFSAWYADEKVNPSVFQAVRSVNASKPTDINLRVQGVSAFLQLEQAANLAEANKRVSNILAKVTGFEASTVEPNLLTEAAEIKLTSELEAKNAQLQPLLAERQYETALAELAQLSDTIDQFFTDVMVNADDPAVRQNRLSLVYQLRQCFLQVADISLLQF